MANNIAWNRGSAYTLTLGRKAKVSIAITYWQNENVFVHGVKYIFQHIQIGAYFIENSMDSLGEGSTLAPYVYVRALFSHFSNVFPKHSWLSNPRNEKYNHLKCCWNSDNICVWLRFRKQIWIGQGRAGPVETWVGRCWQLNILFFKKKTNVL